MNQKKYEVFVSVGSNIEPKLHVLNSLKLMTSSFGELRQSRCYESKAVGFDGDNFLNLVVAFETHLTVAQISAELSRIEDNEGRERHNGKAWDSRTLDLDILLYGDKSGVIDGVELPRSEVLDQAHVLIPLVELIGNKTHPDIQKTYAEILLTQNFSQQDIWEVSLL